MSISLLTEYGDLLRLESKLKAEIEIIQAKLKEVEKGKSEIKTEILSNLITSGKSKMKIAGWSLNVGNYSSTIIEDQSEIPELYFRIKREADLMKIKAAIKAGIDIPGVQLVKSKSLTIKPQKK
jgi:roadblock/LC7 domain-containing protein